MTKPFEGARLLVLALVAFVVFVCLAGCTPPPQVGTPWCVDPDGITVPCTPQKP